MTCSWPCALSLSESTFCAMTVLRPSPSPAAKNTLMNFFDMIPPVRRVRDLRHSRAALLHQIQHGNPCASPAHKRFQGIARGMPCRKCAAYVKTILGLHHRGSSGAELRSQWFLLEGRHRQRSRLARTHHIFACVIGKRVTGGALVGESVLDRGLHDIEIRRDIEVARRVQAEVPDVEQLA